MSTEKTVTLKSSDGVVFEIAEAVALQSQTIKHMIEDDCTDSGIPLPHVTGKILSKVIEYCKNHVEAQKTNDVKTAEDDLKSWDAEFVKVDQATLLDLILAANYLNIKSLLDLTCQTVADMVKRVMSTVMLRSSDGEVFVIDVAVALQSQRIKHMIEDVPLPNATEKILLKVIEYCWNHVDAQKTSNEKIAKDDLKSWDAEFIKVVQDTLFDIPLPNVTGKILSKVIEYCSYHVDAQKKSNEKITKDDLKSWEWDAEFVKVDQHTLFNLILAANYLNIKSLLDLTCQAVADMLKGRTPEEIRKIFNIENNFTLEDEEEFVRENQWAFE